MPENCTGSRGLARNGGNIHVHPEIPLITIRPRIKRHIGQSIPLAPLEIRDASFQELIRISPASNYMEELVAGPGGLLSRGLLEDDATIVHTMGSKITKLKPVGGFCAETAALRLSLQQRLPDSRFHYSHDYWRNRGRGSNKTIFRSQNGESLGYRVGMGINNPDGWRIRGTLRLCH